MLRKLLKLTGILVLALFLVATLAFTSNRSKNVVCRNIEVEFNSDDIIKLSKDEIIRMVKLADNHLIGKRLSEVNSEFVEREVEKNPAILKADVYKVIAKDSSSFKGILAVRVKHRLPVVRIMSSSGSYYLDKSGDIIPVSISYAANVLVVTGYFSEKYARRKILPFVLFLMNDEFWKAQIEQVHVKKNGDVILTPLVGDQLIELGHIDNFRGKLRNLKAFYQQVLANNNWEKYKTISLKFKNQVIAKKR